MAKFMKMVAKKSPVPHKILSDRGVRLEMAQRASENSNIHNGETAFLWVSPDGNGVQVKVGHRCPSCKKRVRGVNHKNGAHHNGTVNRRSR